MTCPKLVWVAKRSTLISPKLTKTTKINYPKLSIITSNFLDFHGIRKRERDRERDRERQRERELIRYKEVCSFLIFHNPTVALWIA